MRNLVLLPILSFALLSTGCLPPPAPPEDVAQWETRSTETERVKAEAGVGKQGQVIGDKEGFLRTPAKALFTAKQKIAFMSVQQALNLYEAAEGHKPKTHEEFMEKIIEFNKINLPELPEGQFYVWDSESGELMVEKPKS